MMTSVYVVDIAYAGIQDGEGYYGHNVTFSWVFTGADFDTACQAAKQVREERQNVVVRLSRYDTFGQELEHLNWMQRGECDRNTIALWGRKWMCELEATQPYRVLTERSWQEMGSRYYDEALTDIAVELWRYDL